MQGMFQGPSLKKNNFRPQQLVSYLEQLEHYRGITLTGQIIITVWPASTLGQFHPRRFSTDILQVTQHFGQISRCGHRGRQGDAASAFTPDGKPGLTSFLLIFAHLSQFQHGRQSMLFLLREISPAAKDGIMRPVIKSNECRCIYEMQASVYSNNFSQRGLSLRSTLRIDHLLNTSHLSCSVPSNLPQQNIG